MKKYRLVLILLPLAGIVGMSAVAAQSITPANDGTGTTVTQEGNRFNIDGGSFSGDGANLFHSLEKFGLNPDQIANFLANPQIQNILTRVVGGDTSLINGLIQVTGGNANLFIMNPNGIIFGPNARLDLRGDFTATTATGIGFGSDRWFNALGNQQYSQLMGDPSQFAFDLTQSGSIINAGKLEVAAGQNLTLLGSIVVNTGTLGAPNGNINIAAIPGTNRVKISQTGNLLSLEIPMPRTVPQAFTSIQPLDLPTLLTQGSNGLALGVTTDANGNLVLASSGGVIDNTAGTAVLEGTVNTAHSSSNVNLIGTHLNILGKGKGTITLNGLITDIEFPGGLPDDTSGTTGNTTGTTTGGTTSGTTGNTTGTTTGGTTSGTTVNTTGTTTGGTTSGTTVNTTGTTTEGTLSGTTGETTSSETITRDETNRDREAAIALIGLNEAYADNTRLQIGFDNNLGFVLPSDKTASAAVEQADVNFSEDVASYLEINSPPPLTIAQIQAILRKNEQEARLKSAILYISFKPQPTVAQSNRDDQLWTFSSSPNPQTANETVTEQLELLLVSASGTVFRTTVEGVSREEVMQMAQQFQRTVTNPRRPSAYLAPAQQLYQWLIAPVEAELKARQIQSIGFVVEAGLRSVPMAALHDGDRFLVERYNMGMMPSVALTNFGYININQQRVLAMGADRFTQQNPLPAVPTELTVIADRVWQGKSHLNEEFTRNTLEKEHASGQFGIIHLATHANFETGPLGNSYIQFWNDRLTLAQLKELNFGDPPIALLVLSACRTALGDRESELGFAGAAVLAKVRTVLGSFWEVNDEGTLGLMTSFYEQLRTASVKAEALRQAQLNLLRGEVRIEGDELVTTQTRLPLPPQLASVPDQDFSHPYYWSAFMLIGSPW